MNRDDFNLLNNNIIYFDNAATTLKPLCVIDSINDYYNNYSTNIHRGDYSISVKAETCYEDVRKKIANLINADVNEIVFTSGTTDSLNKVVLGYFKNILKENDEVLITKSEHASLVLPFFNLVKTNKIKVNYIPLDKDYSVSLENIKNSITINTKVIALAGVTNAIGDLRPLKEIIEYAHKFNILVVVDGAQLVPHTKVDVKEIDCDFLAFSAHKMLGPTGVGVLYGKYKLLDNMEPIILGGGMNGTFLSDFSYTYSNVPYRFEAGTPNVAGVIGFGRAIDYINNIGLDNIEKYELELKEYLINKLSLNENITIYNKNSKSGIVLFNYEGIFSQDLAIYLDKYNICVRAGNHCSKLLKDELDVKNTVRISLYFYNTKEEIDTLVNVLNNPNIKEEII